MNDPGKPVRPRRLQAVAPEQGDFVRANPNSGVVWHYSGHDRDGNGRVEFEETMHRTLGTVAIKDGLLFLADSSGLFHCLDAKTGRPHWSYDLLAACWGSALIADGKVYLGDEDGDVAVFRLSSDPSVAMHKEGSTVAPRSEINMGTSVYTTPVVANRVLYIASKTHLFAIADRGDR